MQYTVKDVLANTLLNSAKLLTAEHAAAVRPVESVSVIEMPVEDFVSENELVLTTAIGCGNTPALFKSFVKDVYKSGASALAVAIGRHVDSIPQEIINFANQYDFPIIELPWETRFSDIMKTIFEQINQWHQHSMAKTESIQRELLRLFLDNYSLQEALNYLAVQFHTTIYLLQQGKEAVISPGDKRSMDHFDLCDLHNKDKMMFKSKTGTILQKLPVHIFNHESGILLIESEAADTPPIPWPFLNQTVTTLTLWLQKEHTALTNKSKKMEEFIQLLTKGEWVSNDNIIDQGNNLGINMELSYVCILGWPEQLPEFLLKHHYTVTNHSWTAPLSRKLKEVAESAAGSLGKQIFCTYQRDRLVIYLECHLDDPSQCAHTFLDILDNDIENGEIPLFSWGIGENHAGILTFQKSYKNARTALEIGRSHKGPGQRSTYANTGMYRLLTSISNDSAAIELMHSTISAVAIYDRGKGLDLLHTLACYINNQGNASQTSRALSLHRQSLLYRLRKIESLTERSLSDPDDLFLLQLCLKLWTVRFESNTQENQMIGSL